MGKYRKELTHDAYLIGLAYDLVDEHTKDFVYMYLSEVLRQRDAKRHGAQADTLPVQITGEQKS